MSASSRPDLSAVLGSIQTGLAELGMSATMQPTAEPTPGGTRKAVVRRRGRAMRLGERTTVVRLIRQPDGLLIWHAGPVGRPVNTGRRRALEPSPPAPPGQVVEMYRYDLLTHNQINDLVIKTDKFLTGELLGLLRLAPAGDAFIPVEAVDQEGPRLLIVHGTFSNTEKMLKGCDPAFLQWARSKYGGRVYAFNHPTLAISPMMNAFDLWRAFRDVEGDLDIVAHSRGGLVVRWFLEALGPPKLANVRAVLVGSPLGGTSLAAPRQLRDALSAISSFASAVSQGADAVASVGGPWLAVPAMVVRIGSSVIGKTLQVTAGTPILDAVISMVPGLSAQARINSNAEISRMHGMPDRPTLHYYGITSNFEPTDPGWKFWQRLRPTNLANAAADGIFPKENDMVVDTGSMSELGAGRLLRRSHDYGTNPDVHHLNYFTRPTTTLKIQSWLT
jgi:hypothetical protein